MCGGRDLAGGVSAVAEVEGIEVMDAVRADILQIEFLPTARPWVSVCMAECPPPVPQLLVSV